MKSVGEEDSDKDSSNEEDEDGSDSEEEESGGSLPVYDPKLSHSSWQFDKKKKFLHVVTVLGILLFQKKHMISLQ